MPRTIGAVVSNKLATLADLSDALSLEDLHDLLEIAVVDAQNTRIMSKRNKKD